MRERLEIEKTEKLLKMIESHPLTQQIRAAEAAEVLAKRKAASEAIVALQREQAENIPKLRNDLKIKEKNYLTAKAMLDKTTDEVRFVKATLLGVGNSFDTAIRTHEEILLSTYDLRIDEAIEFFKNKLDFLRKPGRITRVGRKSETNLVNWAKKTFSESNVQAINNAMSYCLNAITELEKIKLVPEFDEAKLQKLKDNIPAIDVYKESTGQAPMERLAPTIVPPCDYSIKKLLKKVNKHLVTPTKGD